MTIKKLYEFNSNKKELLYYAFDWDDNILNMPTLIHGENKVGDDWTEKDVSTAEFAIIRSNPDWRFGSEAFSEFRDNGPRGESAFKDDVKLAISKKRLGPAWYDFIECLSSACLFAIITARGHESESLRGGVEFIIDNILTENELHSMYSNLIKFNYIFNTDRNFNFDRILKGTPSDNELVKVYLDNCDFVGVSSPSRGGSPSNPEKAKEEALLKFNSKINSLALKIGADAKIGFSDDDAKNVKHVEDLIDGLNRSDFSNIFQYTVKGTKDPNKITKKVRVLENNGMESSILKFTQFGNMTGHLYPSEQDQRQDDYANQFKRQTKHLAKTAKELLGKKKGKDLKDQKG